MGLPTQDVILTRTIQAPPGRVYAAFTSAEGWCQWCCEKAECDARIGGKYHIYTQSYNAYGEFIELQPDKSVSFTWGGDNEPSVRIDVLLHTRDDSTVMTFKVTNLGSPQGWAEFSEVLQRIWGRVLNNLKAKLETKPEK